MASVLSVEEIWVGRMEGVEGVCVVVNKGMATETIMSFGMWTALNAGLELSKRGSNLILESLVGEPKATAEQIKRMNS
jgi:hypothetical protein